MRLSEQTLTQKAIAVVIFLNLLWIQRCKTTSPDGFQTANNTPTRRSHARRHSKSDHSDRYRYVLTSSGVSEKPMTNAHNHDFVLKCPYADLKKAPSSSLEVTWTHNNQQQVTVTHGVPYINPRLPISSIKSKIYKNRTILQVGIDDDHREFHYNEHKERFTFQITRIHSTDLGLWECRIVIDDKGKKKMRISSTSVVSSSSGETLISGSKTNVASTRRTPGSAETPHKAKIEVIAATMRTYERTDVGVFEKLNLYILNDQFFLEPRDRTGELAASTYLEIDRVTNDLRVWDANESPIPIVHAEIRSIFGVVGVVKLISGNGLIVVKRAELVGQVNGHDIWTILETDIIPYSKSTVHLTEKQARFNKHFMDMIQLVLATGGFYYSTTLDITRTFQWLSENATPDFRDLSLMERADERFVWNRYLSSQLIADGRLGKYVLPIMHGFVGIRRAAVNGSTFQLAIISRRSVHRAGVRFFMRGVNSDGHSANYVETEQIVQFDRGSPENRTLTSFVQIRGSIPLYWCQYPNLRWQPMPTMKPNDHQLDAYTKHMKMQRDIYGGKHVIVNLVNQKGREKRIGGELERIIVQANLDYVRYNGFDFHKECHAMNWDRLSVLQDQLTHEIGTFGFFFSSLNNLDQSRMQTGYFRTNCMDCLDRTNVVQAMIAKESLLQQLVFLEILPMGASIDSHTEFHSLFKNLWADNGDECSKQYAGTGALKADFTRIGKRTYGGAMNDGVNALTRYFKNNFYDGYRQDAIDLFLGNFRVDSNKLPDGLEQSIINFDFNGVAILFAIFAAAMIILCLIIAENYTVSLFWLVVLALLMSFIVLNGEEFVNQPKLKVD